MPTKGREEENAIVFEKMWADDGPRCIQARLSCVEKDGAAEFVISVLNEEIQLRVVETLFELCSLDFGEGEDTALLYPHHSGEKIVDPANTLRSQRYRQFWRAGTTLVNGEGQRECNYCGLCSMSYMYLQNKRVGLYLKILSELRERMRRRDPDSYLMTENCGDIYSAFTWGNLTWNGADYDEFYNMFRYTFPEFMQVNMCNDRSWAANDEERERFFYADIERCVLMGNILWIGITSRYLNKPELKVHFDYLMAATAFRKAIARQVSDGTYLDDAYVTAIGSPLHASCFRVSDFETLLLVGDHALHGGKVTFTLPYTAAHVEAFDEYEQPLSVLIGGDQVTLSMRNSRLARIHIQAGERCK